MDNQRVMNLGCKLTFYRQLLAFSIIAIMVGCTMVGCTDDLATPQVDPPVEAGLDSPDEELASFLTSMYQQALEDPESSAARGNLGIAYEINTLTEAGRQSYVQAEALDPDEFRWPYFRSLMLVNRGEHELALELLDRALALDPDYLPAWLWRGTILLDLNRDEQAAAAFQRAVDLNGGLPARAGVARTLIRRGQPEQAAGLLEPLLAEYRHPYVYRLLGRCYRALGNTDEAEIALLRGSQAEPIGWYDERKFAQWEYVRSFTGLLNYAQLLISAQRGEESLRVLETLREREPDNEVLLNNLSAAYARLGKTAQSVEVLKYALDVYPDSFSFHLNIAVRYQKRGDVDLALEHLERAVELSPDLSPGHEMIGEILASRGENEAALAAFQKARSPKGYYYMGMIKGAGEDWPKAIEYFEKSIGLDPTDAKARVYLGRSFSEGGRYEESRATLRRARRLGAHPDDLAGALQRLDDLERDRSHGPDVR